MKIQAPEGYHYCNMKVCKICGIMQKPHAPHICSDNKLVPGRSSKMIPINTTYQYSEMSDSGEYVVKNKPYIHDESDCIYINVYENGLKNTSEVFNTKTVKELFEVCSKLKIDGIIEYNKDFIYFDIEEIIGCDFYTDESYIGDLKIRLYKANNYKK